MVASIKIDQARPSGTPSSGTPSIARNDLWREMLISLTSSGGGAGPNWSLLFTPSGSNASLSTTSGATTNFTPDIVGTYRIQLTVDDGTGTNKQILVARVRFDENGDEVNFGIVLPAPGERKAEANYENNTRGWDEPFNRWLNYTLSLTASSQSPAYLALSTSPSLTNERVLSVSGTSGLKLTDAGAGGLASLSINDNIVSTISSSVFTNVAALTSSPGTNNQVVELLGYYTASDGGSGRLYWDATSIETHNSGTIFKVTGVTTGRWKRLHTGPFNVKWFGAKGDTIDIASVSITASQGTFTHTGFTSADIGKGIWIPGAGTSGQDLVTTITNVAGNVITLNTTAGTTVTNVSGAYGTRDHVAFANAISAAMTTFSGARIDVPQGVYFLPSFVDVSNAATSKYLRLHGLSKNSELRFYVEDAIYALPANNIEIDNLKIAGKWSRAINLNIGSNISIHDNYIDGGTRTPDVGSLQGIECESITNLWIVNNAFRNISHATVRNQAISAGSAGGCFNVVCTGNNVRIQAWGGGFLFYDINNFEISNNIIDLMSAVGPGPEGGFGYGILAYSGTEEVSTQVGAIIGNVCKNTPASGIHSARCAKLSVAGNACINNCTQVTYTASGLEVAGIGIQGFFEANVSVVNNVVSASGQYGIALQGYELTCVGNTVDRCSLAGITVASAGFRALVEGNAISRCKEGIDQQNTSGFLRGAKIVKNSIELSSVNGIVITEAQGIEVDGNHILHCGNTGIAILSGSNNIISNNQLMMNGGYGLDLRTATTTVTNNIGRGNVAGGVSITSACRDVFQSGNRWYENGESAKVTGSVDISTLSYDPSTTITGKTLYYVANGVSSSVAFTQQLRNFHDLIQWFNEYAPDIYASLGTSNHTVLETYKGGTGSTLSIVTGANDAASTLGLTGLSDTGAAPGSGNEINDNSVGRKVRVQMLPPATVGYIDLTDGGGVAAGDPLIAIRQDDNTVRAIQVFDNSQSTTVPASSFYGSSTSFVGLLGDTSGAFIWIASEHQFRASSGNPNWTIRDSGPRGIWAYTAGGAQTIGQDDTTVSGSSGDKFRVQSQKATGAGSFGGDLELEASAGTNGGGVWRAMQSGSSALEIRDTRINVYRPTRFSSGSAVVANNTLDVSGSMSVTGSMIVKVNTGQGTIVMDAHPSDSTLPAIWLQTPGVAPLSTNYALWEPANGFTRLNAAAQIQFCVGNVIYAYLDSATLSTNNGVAMIAGADFTGSRGALITGSVLETAHGRRIHVTTITGSYTILNSDHYVSVNASAALTISMPANPTLGDIYIITDIAGNALINNITINGNGKNIDGNPTQSININYESLTIYYNGTSWSIT